MQCSCETDVLIVEVIDFLSCFETYLIVGHKEPDGDCIGSQLALARFLQLNTKKTVCISAGPFLRTEIKGNTKTDPRLLEARFKYGMVLLGISLLEHFEKEKEVEIQKNGLSIYDEIFSVSKAISPILLPMIVSLGDLELD